MHENQHGLPCSRQQTRCEQLLQKAITFVEGSNAFGLQDLDAEADEGRLRGLHHDARPHHVCRAADDGGSQPCYHR